MIILASVGILDLQLRKMFLCGFVLGCLGDARWLTRSEWAVGKVD